MGLDVPGGSPQGSVLVKLHPGGEWLTGHEELGVGEEDKALGRVAGPRTLGGLAIAGMPWTHR